MQKSIVFCLFGGVKKKFIDKKHKLQYNIGNNKGGDVMKKGARVFLLALVIACAWVLFGCILGHFRPDPLKYELSEDGTYYIVVGYESFFDGDGINVPDTYEDKPVEVIGVGAFENCKVLRRLSLGANVRVVEERAFFGCSNLEQVEMGESLEKIETYAFDSCHALRTVILFNSNVEMGRRAFGNCVFLNEISLPNNTVADWQEHSASFNRNWDSYTGKYTVNCSDGVVEKSPSNENSPEQNSYHIELMVSHLLTKQESCYIGSGEYSGKTFDLYIYKHPGGEYDLRFLHYGAELRIDVPDDDVELTSLNETFEHLGGRIVISKINGRPQYISDEGSYEFLNFHYFSLDEETKNASFDINYIGSYVRREIFENGICALDENAEKGEGGVFIRFDGATLVLDRKNAINENDEPLKVASGLSYLKGSIRANDDGELYYVTLNGYTFKIDLGAFSSAEFTKADLIRHTILEGMMKSHPTPYYMGSGEREHEENGSLGVHFNWNGMFYVDHYYAEGINFCEFEHPTPMGFTSYFERQEKVPLDTVNDELAAFGGSFTLCGGGIIEYVSDDGAEYTVDLSCGESVRIVENIEYITAFIKSEIEKHGEVYIGTTDKNEDIYLRAMPDGTVWYGRNNAQKQSITYPLAFSSFIRMNEGLAEFSDNLTVSNDYSHHRELCYVEEGYYWEEPLNLIYFAYLNEFARAQRETKALDAFFYEQLDAGDGVFYIGRGTSDASSIEGGTGEYYLVRYSDKVAHIKEWHCELGLEHDKVLSTDETVTFSEYNPLLQALVDEYKCTLSAFGRANIGYRSEGGFETFLYYDETQYE